jgi:hypothetical protein
MTENSLIRTLQDTIESQNKTIEGLRQEFVNVNIRMIKKWKIIMYKKWPKAFQIPSSNYYLSTEF